MAELQHHQPNVSNGSRRADRAVRALWIRQRREARSARVPRLLQAMAGVELDISTHNVLIALADGGPTRLTDLARRTGTDLSTVSRQVSGPEALGLIVRKPGPPDGKGQLIDLSSHGRRVVARLMRAWDRLLDPVLEGWSDAELTHFERSLARFVAALESEVSRRTAELAAS